MKRKRNENESEDTPSKRTRADPVYAEPDSESDDDDDDDEVAAVANGTPSKKKTTTRTVPLNSTPKNTNKTNGILTNGHTPKSNRKISFATPTKGANDEDLEKSPTKKTPKTIRNADRSAKKKSAARLIERTIAPAGSENEEDEEEDHLARAILEEEDAEEEVREEEDELPKEPETPSKRGRGRPKGSKNRRSPTPPLANLPPHEIYFWQNKPGSGKTSNNVLSSHLLLNHDEYFAHKEAYIDPHEQEREFLLSLHQSSFPQWDFELREGFNICLYGYGSKRSLMQSYAQHMHDSAPNPPKICIINGYNTSIALRDILTTIASTLFPKNAKLPLHQTALLQLILETLADKPPKEPIYVLINSLDGTAMRRPTVQSAIATLASNPHVCIIATADTPNFPLMWDITLRQQYRFLFHDCTTFVPFDGAEIDVVESVNELLGRSGRRIGGRDGVGYVLRSLPENARNLYRILVAEQLAGAIEGEDGEEQEEGEEGGPQKAGGVASGEKGVEYRVLYHKAREELVCSTEHQFRGLMKEFYDHQMVESRRDGMGTERLIVPFRREDLEGLLEDLVE
ncbi:ORC2-domain-containing protein [Venturia nashicola]|nr:ORC2-domain-containing protein [Venturia nashicola]